MQTPSRVFPLLAVVLLAGCNALGPSAVEGTRVAYNEVLARTQDEQLLLNLVRLRYVDVPMFLEVASVNTQFEFRANAEVTVDGEFGDSLSEYSGELGVGVAAVEKPTVSYVPLQGNDFVERLMRPFDLDTIVLMTRGGWSAHRVLRACAQSLCGLPNAPTAAGPAPDSEPEYREFNRAVALLREHQKRRAGGITRDEAGGYHLVVDADLETTPELFALLGLTDARTAPLRAGARREPGAVTVETRSMLGAMFYLSQGIDVPDEHAARGFATRTPGAEWDETMRDLFHVRTSTSRPDAAAVAVRHRGWWYWIDDGDRSSKATFAMLSYLFAIQSGERDARGPALTIGL